MKNVKKLNKNHLRRDQIIFGDKTPEYLGGVASFTGLTVKKLGELLRRNFADPEDCQNDSPSIKEFYEFAKKYSHLSIGFHGYVVSPERDDYRVSIEGLEYMGHLTTELAVDFTNLCRDADDFSVDTQQGFLYCWYD